MSEPEVPAFVSDITPMPPYKEPRTPTQRRAAPDARAARFVAPAHASNDTEDTVLTRSDSRRSVRSGLSALARSSTLEATPPSLRHAPNSAWQRFTFWLLAPAPHEAAPPLSRLPIVQEDFLSAIEDLPGHEAHALRYRIMQARSLRDLWHLRAEIFGQVGLEASQWEAERRLVRLNRHFPTRANARSPQRGQGSQFGAL
jgi:hypothetical protein